MVKLGLFIFLLFFSCFSKSVRQMMQYSQSDTFNLQQDIFWFDQILDHFNYQASNTWQQRYFVFDTFFNPKTGPIILYICGEGECKGISDQSFTAKIAESTSALVVALEHRYYGKSLPFGNSSIYLQNLKFLNAQQALRDLSYFLTKMKNSGLHKITNKNPWITIGGSYPGALSAWFRSKYPDLTIGALSSSGVILAVEDFRMFDEQIYISSIKSGKYCVDAIINTTNYVQDQLSGDKKQQFKASFNASLLTIRQFLFYWSDAIVFQIQYGNRTQFCNSLKNKTLEQQFNLIKGLVLKVAPYEYGVQYLKNESLWLQTGKGSRYWMYQSCTQFSYFQTYAKDHPMRSRLLTIDFYRKLCGDVYGTWPFVDRVNTQLGGLNINANNLMMTNGDQDPWQWASLQKSKKAEIYTKIITCDDCSHCIDLHAPTKNDSKDLTDTRTHELETIKKWISDYWKTVKN